MRQLVMINLGFVALQALSAGLLMSGYDYASRVHQGVAVALQLGAVIQAVTATVQWRRRRVPRFIARASIALLVMVFLQVWAGFNREYWLHVPIGVGLVVGLIRQKSVLDAARSATSVLP